MLALQKKLKDNEFHVWKYSYAEVFSIKFNKNLPKI
jgi:hypothetical protein